MVDMAASKPRPHGFSHTSYSNLLGGDFRRRLHHLIFGWNQETILNRLCAHWASLGSNQDADYRYIG
jgi:hypothetical protein